MRVWLFGGSGMLGSEVLAQAQGRGHEVEARPRKEMRIDKQIPTHWFFVRNPDVIINCAGALPGAPYKNMVRTNTLGPHNLASLGVRLVHMSTDCVFSGYPKKLAMQGAYHSSDLATETPDPIDLYGRTKLAGEPQRDNVLVVRGSFVGQRHGFLRWLLDAKGTVQAWTNARWNGTSVKRMAEHIVDLAEGDRTGVVHVAAPEFVTKAWMVEWIVDKLNLPVNVELKAEPKIWRALWPDVETVPVKQALDELIEEIADGRA